MREFYGDIEVVERRRIRVNVEAESLPTKPEMLEILRAGVGLIEITDEEHLEYVDVKKIIDLEDVTQESKL